MHALEAGMYNIFNIISLNLRYTTNSEVQPLYFSVHSLTTSSAHPETKPQGVRPRVGHEYFDRVISSLSGFKKSPFYSILSYLCPDHTAM